jgi:hypothetical protein
MMILTDDVHGLLSAAQTWPELIEPCRALTLLFEHKSSDMIIVHFCDFTEKTALSLFQTRFGTVRRQANNDIFVLDDEAAPAE